jgi:hypothetical protein
MVRVSGNGGGPAPAAPEPEAPPPEISVVIASVNGLPYPLACLDALARQEGAVRAEIILADCTGPATLAAVRERHPDVRILSFDERRSVPWLRAAGIRAARGRLVAVTEDHCVPHTDWFRRITEALARTGWSAVGGGVENGSTKRVVDWAVYFCEYSQLMDPVVSGPNNALPGMNVAYDMRAMDGLRDAFEEGLWENFIHDRLLAAGHTLGLAREVVVSHEKYFTIPMFWSERFHYSRSFAGMRVSGRNPIIKLAWALATLALPPLLVGRITKNVMVRRQHLGWFVRALPLVIVFSTVWAAGECWGYLTGPGDSLVKVR